MNATLVLGTTNQGKVRELLELLEPFGMVCASLTGLVGAVDVAETGSTFAENAALKAQAQARALGSWVLAEDSGLVVPALPQEEEHGPDVILDWKGDPMIINPGDKLPFF